MAALGLLEGSLKAHAALHGFFPSHKGSLFDGEKASFCQPASVVVVEKTAFMDVVEEVIQDGFRAFKVFVEVKLDMSMVLKVAEVGEDAVVLG